jgi:hypothetical protein
MPVDALDRLSLSCKVRTGAALQEASVTDPMPGAGLIPPTIYYAKVGGELAKLIYTGRGMQPP